MSAKRMIGINVKYLRLRERLSVETLAERSQVSVTWLQALEAGEGNPSLQRLENLARALHVPVAELVMPTEH